MCRYTFKNTKGRTIALMETMDQVFTYLAINNYRQVSNKKGYEEGHRIITVEKQS